MFFFILGHCTAVAWFIMCSFFLGHCNMACRLAACLATHSAACLAAHSAACSAAHLAVRLLLAHLLTSQFALFLGIPLHYIKCIHDYQHHASLLRRRSYFIGENISI